MIIKRYAPLWAFLLMCASIGHSRAAEVLTPAQDGRLGTATHFGIHWAGWNADRLMPVIRQAGFGWIRDEIHWDNIEKSKGKYTIPDADMAWIKAAHQNNLKLILVLNSPPPRNIYADAYDSAAYAAFATAMAEQLKDYVDCFEILNEPYNFGFREYYGGTWNGNGNSPWLAKYVALCNKAAEAIKAVNPNVKVIGLGSVAPVNFRQLALGLSPAVDGIVDHPYSYRSVPEIIPYPATPGILNRDGIATADELGTFASTIRMFREQSARYKGPKEVWLTEWGFPTYQPAKPQQYAGLTPNAQAKYIQRRIVEGLGLGVDVSIQYDFKNDGVSIREPEHNFGLIDSEFRPKPAYAAVQRAITIMRPWKATKWGEVDVFPAADRPDQWPIVWDGSKIAAPGSIMSYQFTNSQGTSAVAIWSAERADGDYSPRVANIDITTTAAVSNIQMTDMWTGQTRDIPFSTNGKRLQLKDLTIPDAPVLLVLSGSGASAALNASAATTEDQFAKGLAWNFIEGSEFPGAKGSFQVVNQNGKEVGKLIYDFTGGGEYVAANANVTIPETAKELSVKVKGAESLRVLVRLVDSTEQTHQFNIVYSQAGEYQTVRIDLKGNSQQSWSGANDRKIHLPVKQLWLGVDKVKTPGSVEFSHLQWE